MSVGGRFLSEGKNWLAWLDEDHDDPTPEPYRESDPPFETAPLGEFLDAESRLELATFCLEHGWPLIN